MSKNNDPICVGDTVYPLTEAGLCLSARCASGSYDDNRGSEGVVLRGAGKVLEVRDVVSDYDTFPALYHGLGKITIRFCRIECSEGIGWGSGVYKPVYR